MFVYFFGLNANHGLFQAISETLLTQSSEKILTISSKQLVDSGCSTELVDPLCWPLHNFLANTQSKLAEYKTRSSTESSEFSVDRVMLPGQRVPDKHRMPSLNLN